jgi:DNA helicase-2/ATP-dependent DNA helicase PcrA
MTSRIGNPDMEADLQLRACLDQVPLRSFVMVAGAGSGKTTSLVKGLDHLARTKGPELRRRGQRIGCITYTDVAVQEISGDVGNVPLFHVSTIHSFLWTVVRPFQNDLRRWVVRRILEKIAAAEAELARPSVRETTKARHRADIERYREQERQLARVESFKYGTGSDYARGILGHDDILKVGPALLTEHIQLRQLVAKRFPYIVVDESQDTNPTVVEALRQIVETVPVGFCLGFFGDPMQKIYTTGAGKIPISAGWTEITKPENFRCPQSILRVINRIRREDDGLQQTRGRTEQRNGAVVPVEGTARLFIAPADHRRTERLAQIRRRLAELNDDPLWETDSGDGDVRVLVLVHRMAATRLGFAQLYAALNDNGDSGLKQGLTDGTAWVLRPFLGYLLPLILRDRARADFDVMAMLRTNCPLLSPDRIAAQNMVRLMTSLRDALTDLDRMLAAPAASTIGDVLTLVRDRELSSLDERFIRYLNGTAAEAPSSEDAAVAAFLACPAMQLWGYRTYIESQSPFATQQGIKGAEFQRVLIILDDEEGAYNLFSYGKYFGFTELSNTDRNNEAIGEDSVISRTRRLFYVCCSRAVRDLAVILVAPDVAAAREAVRAKGLFEPADVHLVDG